MSAAGDGMRGRHLASALTAAALAIAPTSARPADEAATRAQLEQKIRLAARLIEDSPAARRIGSSGNPHAVGHLDEGRLHHSLALERLARGDLEGARRAVDDALQHLATARRMVPDAPALRDQAKKRYEQLSASLAPLLESWRFHIGATGSVDGDELTATISLFGRARQLADEGRHGEANQVLVQAEQRVLQGMQRSLHATTLDYTARPTTPSEEFSEESARYRAHAELLPQAIRDLSPLPDAMVLITRYREAGGLLQAQAAQQFEAGETARALKSIRNATLYLQRALLAAGLVVPQSSEDRP